MSDDATSHPTPVERAIALLETFAESGMEAVDADSQPTPNARYCLETAADLKALSAPSERGECKARNDKWGDWLCACGAQSPNACPVDGARCVGGGDKSAVPSAIAPKVDEDRRPPCACQSAAWCYGGNTRTQCRGMTP